MAGRGSVIIGLSYEDGDDCDLMVIVMMKTIVMITVMMIMIIPIVIIVTNYRYCY